MKIIENGRKSKIFELMTAMIHQFKALFMLLAINTELYWQMEAIYRIKTKQQYLTSKEM